MGGVILILGGTAEGRQLAAALSELGCPAVLSLAGRTRAPLSEGPVRTGGFGGVEGLRSYLRTQAISQVVDATHPFAEQMTRHAVSACAAEGVPLLRLERPSWGQHVDAGRWHWVDDHAQAASLCAALPGPVLLTVGRLHTGDYVDDLGGRRVVARVAEAPALDLPAAWTLLCARGPFDLTGERALMQHYGIRVLVTKDAGGAHTDAKLQAAAEGGVDVVIVRRPPTPSGLLTVSTVSEVLQALQAPAG